MLELVDLAKRHASVDSVLSPTAISGLQLSRSSLPYDPVPQLQRPAFCYIVQGQKEVTVGDQVYRYGAGEYLVVAVDLPMFGNVLQATPDVPYLSYLVNIDPALVYDLLSTGKFASDSDTSPAVYVGRDDGVLADPLLRLARCLLNTSDAAVLGAGYIREVIYRLLQSDLGSAVRDLGKAGSHTQRLTMSLKRLQHAYTEPLHVGELARLAGMSKSTFYDQFKRLTNLTPIQYQKQLRLHEARRLLQTETIGIADAGFRVGYQSPSQFSREYARLFGKSPNQDRHPVQPA